MSERPAEARRVYYPALDGLRFLAFFAVFLHHVPFYRPSALMTTLHHVGWAGVELFFVISGFLFFRLLAREQQERGRIDVVRFFVRRTLRIWPIYFLFCIGVFVVQAASGIGPAPPARLVAELAFVDNFATAAGAPPPIPVTGHLWTLSFEEQVYLLIPPAFFAVRRLGTRRAASAALALALAAVLARAGWVARGGSYYTIFTIPFLRPEPVLWGALLGWGFANERLLSLPRGVLPACALALLAPTVFGPSIRQLGANQLYLYPTLALAMGAFVLLAVEGRGRVRRWLSSAPMRALGRVSYGLYVYHVAAIATVQWLARALGAPLAPWTDLGDWLLLASSALALTVVVSFASYRFLEAPVLRYKERFALVLSRPV